MVSISFHTINKNTMNEDDEKTCRQIKGSYIIINEYKKYAIKIYHNDAVYLCENVKDFKNYLNEQKISKDSYYLTIHNLMYLMCCFLKESFALNSFVNIYNHDIDINYVPDVIHKDELRFQSNKHGVLLTAINYYDATYKQNFLMYALGKNRSMDVI